MQPWAALIIGATAGGVYVAASYLILHIMRIDDPLDAGAVHAFCGAWGLLMAAAFAHKPSVRAVYGDEIAEAGYGAPPRAVHLPVCSSESLCELQRLRSGLELQTMWLRMS
jgi:ammonia channel protein AmtB